MTTANIPTDHAIHGRRIRIVVCAILVGGLMPLGGCRLPAEGEDLAYPAYGGAWERTIRDSGRVGSVFAPAGAKVPSLASREEPDGVDEIVRDTQGRRKNDNDLNDDRDPDGDPDGDDDTMDLDDAPERSRSDEIRERDLDDIENDAEDRIREKSLDDIEVRIIPGGKPKMVTTK